MLELTALVGNEAVKRRLESGRGLSHAYILAAPAGCGKKTLASLLSAALVCSGGGAKTPCAQCPDCRKAHSGMHPDVIRVGTEGKDVNVAAVRAMRSDAYIRPNEANRKVYLIDHAETMNQSAQNALLKLLEDGPPYAAFLLLTDNAGAMLQTVRSRCEVLTLSPITPDQAQEWLLKRYPQLERAQVLDAAARCEGVLGRAVEALEGGGEAAAENRVQAAMLKGLLLGKSEITLLEYCVVLESRDRDALAALLDETVQQLRDGLSTGDDLRRSLKLIDAIKALRTALFFNAGPGHVAGALCAAAFT